MRKWATIVCVVLSLFVVSSAWSQQSGVSAAQLRSLELQSLGSDAVYSPFGTYLAVITRTNRVRVYNSDYDELWNYRGQGHHGTGPAVAFTSDEEFLVFPGHGNPTRIAVVRAGTGEVVATLDDHTDTVVALALSPDNQWLVSVQSGGDAIVWRRDGLGFAQLQPLEREAITVLSLAFAPSSDLFAVGNNQDYVELFALSDSGGGHRGGPGPDARFQSAGELRPNQYYGNTAYLFGMAFSPDGRWLAAGVRDEITIWELAGTQLVSTDIIPEINEGYCYAIEFSPDSQVLFGGFQGSRAAAWSLQESGGWRHETTFSDRQDYVWDMAISPDGSHLATVSVTSNGVAIWELQGVGPGPLVRLAGMLTQVTGESSPGKAHRSILRSSVAGGILDSLDPALFAPRGMFETAAAYEARAGNAPVAALRAVQTRLLDVFDGRMVDDGSRVSVPVQTQGTYDIDTRRYTTAIMDTRVELAIVPAEAQGLYLNWQSAVVEATRQGEQESGALGDDAAPVFGAYELVHPTTGKRYPVLMGEDPLSGVRFEPEVEITRPASFTDDLVLEELRLDPLFPALYRAYERQPVGHAVLRNTGDLPAENLLLTAMLARYSLDPAVIETPRALAPGDRIEIDLGLVLSDEIVRSGGEETMSIEIAASYETEGRARAGSITVLVPILNRNAIRWDDDLKVGAFMTTVQSPTVMTIAGQAAADTAERIAAALPRQLLIGMRVLEQLRTRGLAYRVDPASAYAALSQQAGSIDFLQFPAETLAYGAGDCDDLSVLYNSILEAAGVRTAFITTPGHIFTAFSVERDARDITGIFPDSGEFIVRDGRVWVPVETTLLNMGFREAWQVGARQWRAAEADRSARLFTTEDAWRVYPPVPWEPPVQQNETRRSRDQFSSELDGYVGEAIELMIQSRDVSEPGTAREFNIRGTIYARFGLLEDARQLFEQAVEMADYVPALVNLASVTALGGDHSAAREILEQADGLSPDNPRILLGLAVQHLEDGQRGSARGFYDRAAAIDPRLTTDFPLFAAVDDSDTNGARASGDDVVSTYRENAWAE
jgi:WD40 repeat protein/tetratricopeptide (TPR) repeat protein